MSRGRHKRHRHHKKRVGQAPGTLAYVGEPLHHPVRLRLIEYDETSHQEMEIGPGQCLRCRESAPVSWVDVVGIHEAELLRTLGEQFALHPLVLEDLVSPHQRPKVEEYPGYLFIVVKMIYLDDQGEVVSEQLGLVLGERYVLSVQEGLPGDVFDQVRHRLRTEGSRIRSSGADYLAYALLDAVVDSYFVVLERLGEQAEQVEARLLEDPSPECLTRIRDLKHQLIWLRRSVGPVRELLAGLQRAEQLVQPETRVFLRDVHDHSLRVVEWIESQRELLSSLLDLYLSTISHKMNEVMKVLTLVGTIFLPLTFIAGVYGMNFKHMPELERPWAYPAIWGVMTAIAGMMLLLFRRKRWL